MGESDKDKPEGGVVNFQQETDEERRMIDYASPPHDDASAETEAKPSLNTDVPKDEVEKDLEGKILSKEFIDDYTKNYLIDLTKRSYLGPYEFLVYKHLGRNMLYFLKRINPEEKDAKYRLHMCVSAANNTKN